jgi:Protein of unknown function (DUF2510)
VHYSIVARGETATRASSGWYPDYSDSTQLRWWDGSQWTTIVRPANAGPDFGGRRLRRAAIVSFTAALTVPVVTYPWVGGDPAAGQVKTIPKWVDILAGIAVLGAAIGIACVIARWFVRRRAKRRIRSAQADMLSVWGPPGSR